jgi:predicted site-specific integrase-resolvase
MRRQLARVTSYGNYHSFEGVSVPTTIKQALNGQEQWTLQLSQVTINTNSPTSTFSF